MKFTGVPEVPVREDVSKLQANEFTRWRAELAIRILIEGPQDEIDMSAVRGKDGDVQMMYVTKQRAQRAVLQADMLLLEIERTKK